MCSVCIPPPRIPLSLAFVRRSSPGLYWLCLPRGCLVLFVCLSSAGRVLVSFLFLVFSPVFPFFLVLVPMIAPVLTRASFLFLCLPCSCPFLLVSCLSYACVCGRSATDRMTDPLEESGYTTDQAHTPPRETQTPWHREVCVASVC